ncbi:hypothetical protein EDD37DRAFT_678120 [Exophiala viscosa]|uniref:uncharacterized protein n=1 Tax=Exophiala viscosa TaxID=2486360 RepID=UPI00219693D1|nr:hypothetical protein EDD37DRAFT_678120 [Exophiala viscosa]
MAPEIADQLDNDRLWTNISNWLSEPDNSRWLLIFDIYVTQRTTALRNTILQEHMDQFWLPPGCPSRSTVVDLMSGRAHVVSDVDARNLARRLDGHPLALATAGAYLKESSLSFGAYLQYYEARWAALASSEQLQDYPERTLHTTWDISLQMIKQENDLAVELLRFLAYLDPRDIWYELFSECQDNNAPMWYTRLTENELSFGMAVKTLVRYCLVQANHQTESYSIHVCFHDWMLNVLNHPSNADRYWLAFDCVVGQIHIAEGRQFSTIWYRRVTPHAEWIACDLFRDVAERQDFVQVQLPQIPLIAWLLYKQGQNRAAERMLIRALALHESILGRDHRSTLVVMNDMGAIYEEQGKLERAEETFQQALHILKKIVGPKDRLTLRVLGNLGRIYQIRGRLEEAEEVSQRALQAKKDTLGLEDLSTLLTMRVLASIYGEQRKLDQAAELYQQALHGYERIVGPKHTETLDLAVDLAKLYKDHGALSKAEDIVQRALHDSEDTVGAEHSLTLTAFSQLGDIYRRQGKLYEAEEVLLRALQGHEERFGAEHTRALGMVHFLGIVYDLQGRLDAAVEMFQRALHGHEEKLGPEHESTLNVVDKLGDIYRQQGKSSQAEDCLLRALQGKEERLGAEHTSTLDTINSLGILRAEQGRLNQAEELFQRALQGYENSLGSDLVSKDVSALSTCNNLGSVYAGLDRPEEARAFYQRALIGFRKAEGSFDERCEELERAMEHLDFEVKQFHNSGCLDNETGALYNGADVPSPFTK